MDAAQSYLVDVLLISTGLFAIAYILWGRIKHEVLIGGHKPGTAAYDAVMKFVANTKYLVISILGTLFFAVNLIFDVRRILQSGHEYSILAVAPIMVLVACALGFIILPIVFGKRR